MTDSQMLDWLHMHMSSWKRLPSNGETFPRYELLYFGPNGDERAVEGIDIRDCVRGGMTVITGISGESE